MQLWVQHRVGRDWLGRPVYRLGMAIIGDAVEQGRIAQHRLASSEIWASPAALALDAEAEAALAKTSVVVFGGRESANKNTAQGVWGLWLARSARKEARVTVGELLAGMTLQSREVAELMAAETGICRGFDALAARLQTLGGYETGAEALIDPTLPDTGMPARDWVRLR